MGEWSFRFLGVSACLVGLGACSGKSAVSSHRGGERGGRAGDTSTGGSSASGSGGASGDAGGGGAAGSGEGGDGGEECTGQTVGVPTRVVRLSFTQVRNALEDLVGEQAANAIAAETELPSAADRMFPPLTGNSVIDVANWSVGDRVGQAVGRHVLENFEAVTDCGATPTDTCGERFVEAFAEKAARRPLTDVERDNFTTVYTECKGFGGTVQEAVQYGVYAVIDSPLFLYRFELGEPDASGPEVALAPHELADLLSFFVTDGPPDQALLARAEDGSISDPGAIAEEVTRLLATPAARENFDTALSTYFGLSRIETVVVDPTVTPGYTESLRNSMIRESELFLEGGLFGGGPLGDLLTGRRSTVNAELAAHYGITGFPNGEPLDDQGFAGVTLPDERAGLLTMPGFLLAHQNPARVSVIERGAMVRALIACDPPTSPDEHPMVEIPTDMTDLERARARNADPECSVCHSNFELYGIPLYAFDMIGRYRTEDEQGNALDVSVTLPERAGGAHVANAREMAAELAAPEVFAACVATHLIEFALGEFVEGAPSDRRACASQDIERSYVQAGDLTFNGLVREVARSPMLTRRVAPP